MNLFQTFHIFASGYWASCLGTLAWFILEEAMAGDACLLLQRESLAMCAMRLPLSDTVSTTISSCESLIFAKLNLYVCWEWQEIPEHLKVNFCHKAPLWSAVPLYEFMDCTKGRGMWRTGLDLEMIPSTCLPVLLQGFRITVCVAHLP